MRITLNSGVVIDVTTPCFMLEWPSGRRVVHAMGHKSDAPQYGTVAVWLERVDGRWLYTSADGVADILRAQKQAPAIVPLDSMPA